MFYDLDLVKSKGVGDAWRAAHQYFDSVGIVEDLPDTCDKISQMMNESYKRKGLSLRTASTLVAGAANLDRMQAEQILNDLNDLDQAILFRGKRPRTSSITDSSDNSDYLDSPEEIRDCSLQFVTSMSSVHSPLNRAASPILVPTVQHHTWASLPFKRISTPPMGQAISLSPIQRHSFDSFPPDEHATTSSGKEPSSPTKTPSTPTKAPSSPSKRNSTQSKKRTTSPPKRHSTPRECTITCSPPRRHSTDSAPPEGRTITPSSAKKSSSPPREHSITSSLPRRHSIDSTPHGKRVSTCSPSKRRCPNSSPPERRATTFSPPKGHSTPTRRRSIVPSPTRRGTTTSPTTKSTTTNTRSSCSRFSVENFHSIPEILQGPRLPTTRGQDAQRPANEANVESHGFDVSLPYGVVLIHETPNSIIPVGLMCSSIDRDVFVKLFRRNEDTT